MPTKVTSQPRLDAGSSLELHSDLEMDQQVLLYPSFAYPLREQDGYRAIVSGLAYREGEPTMRQRMFLRVLRQVLAVEEAELRDSAIFQERIQGFLVDPQRAKELVVKLGSEKPTVLRRSHRNGQFRDHLLWSGPDLGRRVPCQVMLSDNDQRDFGGSVDILTDEGISVISDIDDTIKVSDVSDRGKLLQGTFLRPFSTVPGMAELYSRWHAAGAAFHYVSSSPWQLYRPLRSLLDACGFPLGSFHLRTLQFADPAVVKLFIARKRNKFQVIKTLFRLFPRRRFVLVGDSGEKDPEIYGAMARMFPHQIERIVIRRVEGRRWTRKRVGKAFHDVPRDRWQTFRQPHHVKPFLFEMAAGG